MADKLPEIYYGIFGGTALVGTILGLVFQKHFYALFCFIGLIVVSFWYYKMKGD